MSNITTLHNVNFTDFADAKLYISDRDGWVWQDGRLVHKPKLMHNTWGTTDRYLGRVIRVNIVLHQTVIYSIEKDICSVITLNSGGYQTNVTKDRMNRFLPLGYRISQRKFTWYLDTPDGEIRYTDGMQIYI